MQRSSEFPIFKESKLVGMTIKAIEEEFSVKIDHIHNSTLTQKSRKPPSSDYLISPGIYIKAKGSFDNVSSLYLKAYKI